MELICVVAFNFVNLHYSLLFLFFFHKYPHTHVFCVLLNKKQHGYKKEKHQLTKPHLTKFIYLFIKFGINGVEIVRHQQITITSSNKNYCSDN